MSRSNEKQEYLVIELIFILIYNLFFFHLYFPYKMKIILIIKANF